MKFIDIHAHPKQKENPEKTPKEKEKKRKRKEKNRLVRELLGDEEGCMKLDDSTGQTPSVILSGMTYRQDHHHHHHHHHPSGNLAIQGIFIIHVKKFTIHLKVLTFWDLNHHHHHHHEDHYHPSENFIIHLTVSALLGAWIIIIHMRF